MEEAQTLVAEYKFKDWLANESIEDKLARKERQRRAMDEHDHEREKNARATKKEFDAIVACSGYTNEERNRIRELEQRLASAHISEGDTA